MRVSDPITRALLVLVAIAALAVPAGPAWGQAPPKIQVSPEIPVEVGDPSNLREAAYFAWNEFIALTWPAMAQGPETFPRGQPFRAGKYGDTGPTGQVVWETFRHKVETFPGQGTPNGFNPNVPDFGFGSKPQYVYRANSFLNIPPSGLIPPQAGLSDPAVPPFHNLDEATQITLNAMYSGAGYPNPHGGNNQDTKQDEKILFEAKVNEAMYRYAVQPRNGSSGNSYAYYQSENQVVAGIKLNSVGYAETGDATKYPGPYIQLPASDPAARQAGTIEIKASFRKLNPAKEDTSKFYKAPVRYYVGTVQDGIEKIGGFVDSNDPKINEVWGLTSLHIIQKTPNAPTFIYATFGQINNILDAAGHDVEEPDGTTKPTYLSQAPFLPALNIVPSTPTTPQQVTKGDGQANTNSPQLYYHNVEGKEVIVDPATGKPYTGPVNINRRLFPIPPTITAANRAAHDAIRAANDRAVWLNYRLVNVQARPLDLAAIPKGEEPTYYLSNEVVETNTSLQKFSGGLNALTGTISNYLNGQPIKNTFVVKNGQVASYNMGGCMGCHGSQGQKQGGDFSVLMANGRVPFPDILQADETQAELIRALTSKYLAADAKPQGGVSPVRRDEATSGQTAGTSIRD